MRAGDNIFTIPVVEIDAMFKDYSEYGNNLTTEEMRQKYKLKPQAFDTIKRKLQLYKKSHIISPYTLENTSKEEEEELIDNAADSHIDTKIGKFRDTHDKKFKQKALEALRFKENREYQLEQVMEAIDKHKPVHAEFEPNTAPNNIEAHFVLSDIHLGKTDTKFVIARLDQMYKQIVEHKSDTVHITCLGDLVETLAQG